MFLLKGCHRSVQARTIFDLHFGKVKVLLDKYKSKIKVTNKWLEQVKTTGLMAQVRYNKILQQILLKLVWKYFGFPILCTQQTKTAHFVTTNCTFFSDVCNLNFSSFHHPDSSAIFSSGRCPNLSPISGILQAKLYIPSTINNDYILWQHQLYDPKNMYVHTIYSQKCKSTFLCGRYNI